MNKDASPENTETAKPDRPGVIAPPPVIYLSGIGLGAVIEHFQPLTMGVGGYGDGVGALIVALGFLVIFETFVQFRRARTSPNPFDASRAIVADGPLTLSRNPMYLGMTLVLIGMAGVLDTYWVLVSLSAVLPIMQVGVIMREERYLEAKFGDDYRRYKETVRRWL